MTSRRGRSTSPIKTSRPPQLDTMADEDNILPTRQIEAFSRTVHATASQLIASNNPDSYRSAISSVHRTLRQPAIQRSVFSLAKANPRELIRSRFDAGEIEQRALTWLPEELLRNVPEGNSRFSLFEGFRASLPEGGDDEGSGRRKKHGKHGSKGQRLLEGPDDEKGLPPRLVNAKREKERLDHRLEMMGIRKTMCASEIREIDGKIANLNTMRKVVLERLAGLEQEEHEMEQEVGEATERLEDLQEQLEDEAALATKSPILGAVKEERASAVDEPAAELEDNVDTPGFMSESIYQKLPSAQTTPRSNKKKSSGRIPFNRRTTTPVLHAHMEAGTAIRAPLQAHSDMITALDFDAPFGTMVTAALDDTVRVWDLNAGRCMGMLEGHLSSVRCLQVEKDGLVATGSMDASVRLWDLGRAEYSPPPPADAEAEEAADLFAPPTSTEDGEQQADASNVAPEPHSNSMADCHLITLSAHVAEITALHFRGTTLVSGSADKTLRQWDIEKGRCVQTLDVLWAAAQAESVGTAATSSNGAPAAGGGGGSAGWWRPTNSTARVPSAEADFVGALQVFDAALACGTADGMVRLWDLRSGMVHRSLVGHTGPVTALQFDDTFLVTASKDRSIRIWDLRTGTIFDAFAFDHPVTGMGFDARRIVAAAGESVVKVYDRADGRQWDCGIVQEEEEANQPAVVERVTVKEGYLVEGRRDGVVGIWSC